MENAERMEEDERLRACVHCGLCLSACPTYLELGTEADSPRGRIYLLGALQTGELPLTHQVVRHLDLCLGCRACETACPSGVQYGAILEDARAHIEANYQRPLTQRWWRRFIAAVFSDRRRLRAFLLPVRLLQGLGLWPMLQSLIPAARLVPQLRTVQPLPLVNRAQGTERARVGLFLGCVNRELFAATNAATVRVLNRNGVTVVVPEEQGCCGALHLHGGDRQRATDLARRLLRVFPSDLDAVIVNAAGCGAAMKEYGSLFAAQEGDLADAKSFSHRVRDVNEYLAERPILRPRRALDRRVAVHDACHLVHGQQIREAPRALLRQIEGVELVDLAESEVCCGSAGSYNLTEPRMARLLGERKADNIVLSGATCVATANPGCILQISAGLRARGLSIPVLHPVQLLDEAYGMVDEGEGLESARRG